MARIFKNKMINESPFGLSSKTDMVYAYNVHETAPTIGTVTEGVNVWQFDNYTITQQLIYRRKQKTEEFSVIKKYLDFIRYK